MNILAWLTFLFDILKYLIRPFRKSNFCQTTILILFIIVGFNSYINFYLLKKDQETPSKFENLSNDIEIDKKIKKALNACGDLSFISWSILEDNATKHGKYLHFKKIYGCDKDRMRFNKSGDCVVDIMFNNPIYLSKHLVSKKTLEFIESDPVLPNGTYFEELTPVWFSLINKNGGDSQEAIFLKNNAGEFYDIVNRTNLKLAEIGVIKVRHQNAWGRPVLYIFSFSFLPNAERACLQAGNFLMDIAKTSIKVL